MSLIERFFPGMTLEHFRSAYWLYEPTHARAPLSRFPELVKPLFSTPRTALRMKCSSYRVDMPDQEGKNLVKHSFLRGPEQALDAFERGHTVYMHGLIEDPLPQFAEQITGELDLPVFLERLRGSTLLERYWLAFAARPSKGLRWHWDRHHLVIIQVAGTKKFSIARNQFFRRPTVPPVPHECWRKGMHPQLMGALGRQQISESELPSDAEEFELSAGDTLFIPAGTWHSAETIEDSLHFAYAVKVPTLPEFALAYLGLMHDVFAARFHVPVATTRDFMGLVNGDASNEPLHAAMRAWFSEMGCTMSRLATSDDFARFLQQVTAAARRGAFSFAPKEAAE